MIKGHGVDIVEISRISKMREKYGDVFLNRVYTKNEIEYCESKAAPGLHYAGRWAVKEAFYKALSSITQKQSSWQSIEINTGIDGKPEISVISKKLEESLEKESIKIILVSISHEKKYAIASVIIE